MASLGLTDGKVAVAVVVGAVVVTVTDLGGG